MTQVTSAQRRTAEGFGREVRQQITLVRRFTTQGRRYEANRALNHVYLSARRAGTYALNLLGREQ